MGLESLWKRSQRALSLSLPWEDTARRLPSMTWKWALTDAQTVSNVILDFTASRTVNNNCLFIRGFPGGSDGKESSYSAGDLGLIPGSGRSPGEGNSNPLQYACLENPMDRGAWRATVHGVTKTDTTEQRTLHFSVSTWQCFIMAAWTE